MDAIVKDIITSWREEPDRWRWEIIWMKRDDGLSICMQRPYTGDTDFAVIVHDVRGRIEFGWWNRRKLKKALKAWRMRPLNQAHGGDTP